MIVTCPRCLTKFNLPDENLNSDIEVNLRCSRCKEEFSFSPQVAGSILEGAVEPSFTSEEPDASTNSAENDQSDSSPAVGVADTASEIEFDEDFEAIAEEDTGGSDPIDTVAEDEFDVNELFSTADVDVESEPEVAEDESVAVADDAIFELSDDFDSDETDFNVVEKPVVEDTAELKDEGSKDGDDSAIEELALDIDDIDLGDIEFDSLEDDSATAAANSSSDAKPTKIDDDDDLVGLLDLGSDAEIVVAESAGSPKSNAERVPEEKSSPELETKPVSGGNQKRTLIMVLACFLVLSLALWAGYGLWQRFSVNMAKHLQLQEISNQRLRLPSERIVIVLRGKVVNGSPKLVTDLKIKGVLVDEKGKVLAEVITSGGVSFSEEELDLLDSKKLAMLENSAVNLPPNGGELPFMIAFYDYPAAASECYVELSSFKVNKGRVR